MSVKITWTPDALTPPISSTLVLANSSRSITDHDFRLNNQALIQTSEPFRSDFIKNFFRFNDRVTLGFKVRRDVDFTGTAFPDPETAFAFAALHLCSDAAHIATAVRGTGTLTVLLGIPNITLVFNNAVKQSIGMVEWLGVAMTFEYNFLCSSVTQSP